MPTTTEIKQALRKAGFEVYRTKGASVHIAERVRENLIMDSGVHVEGGDLPAVCFSSRAEKNQFPGEDEGELFERARSAAATALERGFRERGSVVTDMEDPGNPSNVLDHWYQVHYEKPLQTLELALEEVRFAFALDKVAKR